MKNYLNNLSKEVRDSIYLARDIASKNNIPAYLVGGFVRDLILGTKNLDLDIVVEGDGIKFAEDFSSLSKARLIRHRRFGTATVTLGSNLKIDIATARKESYPQPACLPSVSRGTLRDDLFRRDFTINAMAMSIMRVSFGRLVDFFGGMDDLNNKKIRILHNLSFIDDPTRILRAIRFEKRYNFKIEPETFALLREAVKIRMLEKIQPQRLRNELILLCKEERPVKRIRRMHDLTGFSFIHPRLSVSKSTYQLLSAIESQISWFRRAYPQRRKLDTWLMYFIGLIDGLNINDVKSVCNRFVFRKGEEARMLNYKKVSRKVILGLGRDGIKSAKIFDLLEYLTYEVTLLIKAKSSRQSGIPQNAGRNRDVQRHIKDFFAIYNGTRIFTSGDQLRKLGVVPGPYYQKIFAKVLNAKLEGLVKTREEELEFVKRLIKYR